MRKEYPEEMVKRLVDLFDKNSMSVALEVLKKEFPSASNLHRKVCYGLVHRYRLKQLPSKNVVRFKKEALLMRSDGMRPSAIRQFLIEKHKGVKNIPTIQQIVGWTREGKLSANPSKKFSSTNGFRKVTIKKAGLDVIIELSVAEIAGFLKDLSHGE